MSPTSYHTFLTTEGLGGFGVSHQESIYSLSFGLNILVTYWWFSSKILQELFVSGIDTELGMKSFILQT